MEFHMLSRRELQALCKKNKIPANITNVAMVEALNALEIVEGMDEFLTTCESETAQSSIDSPVRSEVTSPCVPLTGGRSTRRRNVAKEEPKTAKQSVTAQRTTRRTRTKDSDEPHAETIETPAVAPHTNRRRKGQMASTCRKMESELKECVEEEKKNVAVTPAPSGVTTRRRRGANVESEATRVYSTRRSVRLAVKDVELSSETGNENHEFSNKELFTNDCEESKMITEEGTADLDEVSGITGAVDADIVTVEVTSERKDEAEVLSVEKHETSSVTEEGKINNSEAVEAELEKKESCDAEIEEIGRGSQFEEETNKENGDETEVPNDENKAKEDEMGFVSETEADIEKEECDITGSPSDGIKAQQYDGSHDIQTSEIEFGVENADLDAGREDQTANLGQNDVLENEEQDTDNDYQKLDTDGDIAVPESEGSHDIQPSEIDAEKREEQNTDNNAGYEDQIVNSKENSGFEREDAESRDFQPSEIEIEVEKAEEQTTENGGENTAGTESEEQNTNKDAGYEDEVANCEENLILESEDNTATSEVSCDTDIIASVHEDTVQEEASENNVDEEVVPLDNSAEEKDEKALDNQVPYLVQPTCLSPTRAPSASKASSAKKKRVTAVSDNKENIASGGKLLVFTKEKAKIAKKDTAKIAADELGDMSVRQLTKLLREKLQITNKPGKNEIDVEAPSRPALQALPENRQAN